jgi:isopentenyl diphosphate isomerase/L-lactate dehydrogenase-like FMN-dependent dehydrogenase
MQEIRSKARELMRGYCRVCPQCDGRACAGEVPGMGGIGTGSSFRNNVEALAGYRFRMSVMHGIHDPSTRTGLLGAELSLPVLAAPMGGVSFNLGPGMSEGEFVGAVVGGCAEQGALGCTGDGVPDEISSEGFRAVRDSGGRGIAFIKPWEDEELFRKLDEATDSGALAVGMDIDAAGLVTLKKMGRPVSPKTADKIREIRDRVRAPFVLKGIMSPDEADKAADAGADAIVVSNHGGRVLDHTPGVAEVLPSAARMVRGRCAVLADGGVRSGADVLKMLCLGADAVLVGRPFAVAAMGGGKEGVMRYLETLRTELRQAMVLTGCPDVASASPGLLFKS